MVIHPDKHPLFRITSVYLCLSDKATSCKPLHMGTCCSLFMWLQVMDKVKVTNEGGGHK